MNNKSEEIPIEVKPLEGYLLYIKFKNGEEKIYDMNEMLHFEYYKDLNNKENFKNVKVSGITLLWATGQDIAPEKIYFNSIPLEQYKGEIVQMK